LEALPGYSQQPDKLNVSFPSISGLQSIWKPEDQLLTLPTGIVVGMKRPNETLNCIVIIWKTLTNVLFATKPLSNPVIGGKSRAQILDYTERIFDCHRHLAKYRCLDRRKIVWFFSKMLSACSSQRSYSNQQVLDLLSKTLALTSPSDTEELQSEISQSIMKVIQKLHSQRPPDYDLEMILKVLDRQAPDVQRYCEAYQA
jgi:hypothetical protein